METFHLTPRKKEKVINKKTTICKKKNYKKRSSNMQRINVPKRVKDEYYSVVVCGGHGHIKSSLTCGRVVFFTSVFLQKETLNVRNCPAASYIKFYSFILLVYFVGTMHIFEHCCIKNHIVNMPELGKITTFHLQSLGR